MLAGLVPATAWAVANFEWLNTNAGGVQAITTIVLVFITAYYALVTAQMAGATHEAVKESARSREQAHRQHLDAALPVVVFQLFSVWERLLRKSGGLLDG